MVTPILLSNDRRFLQTVYKARTNELGLCYAEAGKAATDLTVFVGGTGAYGISAALMLGVWR
jgi:hypothetical protein